MVVVTDNEMFNETIELLECLDISFTVFGGHLKRKYYCAIEIIKNIQN